MATSSPPRSEPSAPRTEPRATVTDATVVGTDAEPEVLGRYRVGAVLGQGGMGVVYSAFDPVLARPVAVKLLSMDVGERAQVRMLREAQAMAKLAHPNVVPVYDAGVYEGRVWVAMEQVRGWTLRDWLSSGPALVRRIDVLLQAGRGLAAAHAAGLVHRDFKPDNVLVREDEADALRAQVLDFGLAITHGASKTGAEVEASVEAILASMSAASLRVTRSGAAIGTPAYMSPEQFRGGDLDARSDQFAFGVTLYEAVWSARPFGGEHARSIAMGVLHEPPRVPTIRGRLERALWRVCARALRREPEDRYPDMPALLRELEAIRRPLARPWPWVALGAATIAGVAWSSNREPPCTEAASLAAEVWGPVQARALGDAFAALDRPWAASTATWIDHELGAWRERWILERTEACRATRVRHEQSEAMLELRAACLHVQLGEVEAIGRFLVDADADSARRAQRVLSGLPEPRACTPDAAGRIDDEAAGGVDGAAVEALRQRLAGTRAHIDAVTDADIDAELAALERDASLAGAPVLEVRVWAARARWLDTRSDPAAATWYERAMLGGLAHHAFGVAADAARELAFVEGARLGKLDQAARSIAVAEAVSPDRGADPRLAHTRAQLAFVAGDYDRARALVGEAIASAEAIGLSARVGNDYNTRGAIELRAGNYDAARTAFERAGELLAASFGTQHPEYGRVQVNLSLVFERLGRLDEAIARLVVGRDVLAADLGAEDPQVAQANHNLAAFLELAGRPDEAEPVAAAALSTLIAKLGADDPRVAAVWTTLGRAQLGRGELGAAAVSLDRAIAVRSAALGPNHPDLALPLQSRARLRVREGRPAVALEDIEHAFALVAAAEFDASDRAEMALVRTAALRQLGRGIEADAWHTAAAVMIAAAGPPGARFLPELDRLRG
jgi:tetratricopeptide (TPR) repeat protein